MNVRRAGCLHDTCCYPSCGCHMPLPKPSTGRAEGDLTTRSDARNATNPTEQPGLQLDALRAEIVRLEGLVYVPGVFRCAKCKFQLVSKTLYVRTGQVGSNNEPQACPNGCGPLWRLSERDYREQLFDDLLKIRNDTLELAAEIADTHRGVGDAAAPIGAAIRGRKTEA